MPRVLHMFRTLDSPPKAPAVNGVRLRNYERPADIERWLELRRRCFARERLGVESWAAADFHRAVLEQPWWNPARLWFAERKGLLRTSGAPAGSVILADRATENGTVPVVHWLMVAPSFRGRGIGRLLLTALETTCWENGCREIRLETYAEWTAAVGLYKAQGYELVDDES